MNADRRILTPVAVTLTAGIMVAAATLGGSFASSAPATKGDRFKVLGESLCAGEAWPNLSAECLAWSEGGDAKPVRYITTALHDDARGVSTLVRSHESLETH